MTTTGHCKTTRRTAWVLLIAIWFQVGVAFGGAVSGSSGGDGYVAICQNGVFALHTPDPSAVAETPAASASCVLCALSSDDAEAGSVQHGCFNENGISAFGTARTPSEQLARAVVLPPSRGPPVIS